MFSFNMFSNVSPISASNVSFGAARNSFPGLRNHAKAASHQDSFTPAKYRPADVVVILAHPDDEILLSGTTAQLAKKGYSIQYVYATSGDQGKNHLSNAPSLGPIREAEARKAIKALGIERAPLFLNFPDGTLPEQQQALQRELETLLKATQPKLVLGFGPDGFTGHSDHIALGALTDAAAKATGNADIVYHTALSKRSYGSFMAHVDERPGWSKVSAIDPKDIAVETSVKGVLKQKLNALFAHATQFTPGLLDDLAAFFTVNTKESFVKAF